MKIVVGSRGSDLAVTQTKWVIDRLKEKNPNVDFEIQIIKTKGDRILDKTLDKIGGKGVFVKEIELQLLEGNIDMAIHSMKDMPSVQPEGLKLSSVPKREDCRDALILKEGLNDIDDVPKGGRIGTGSKRRKYQLLRYRPDLEIVPIRGNIDTRIKKIEDMNLHGIVLAAAGIKRLGLQDKISSYLSEDILIPSPAQGVLAIEIKEGREDLERILKTISDEKSEIQAKAERAFMKGINGDCHIPMGAICNIEKDEIYLNVLYGTEEGEHLIIRSGKASVGEEEELGYKLANEVLKEMEEYEG